MTNEEMFAMLREAFPDETVQDGHRMNRLQVGVVNGVAFELKRRENGEHRTAVSVETWRKLYGSGEPL